MFNIAISSETYLRLQLLILAFNFVAVVGLAALIDKLSYAGAADDDQRPVAS